MLAVFEGEGEVLICKVDSDGNPITGDYFLEDTDSRDRCDYDLSLVETPILITHGSMRVEPEREIKLEKSLVESV